MRITIDKTLFICTGWPLMQQLAAMKAEFKLTANNPYPCFMVTWLTHTYLFTQNGENVETMLGTMKSFAFDEVKDIRELIPNLHWKEGWE